MKWLFAIAAAAGLTSGVAFAQLALPGASDSAPPDAAPTPKPAKPRPHARRIAAAPAAPAAPAVDPASALGHPLSHNGRNGELRLERGEGGALKIVKFSLPGEVVSNPSQQCRIDIVADTPIEAASKGSPDGLARYSADIPACPLTFDVVNDGVLVPAQNNACVFTAADCQASPSGLWGPPAADLDKDPKAILKARAAADRSIQESLRALEQRDDNAAASLAREESDFAAERDEICRGYAGETRLGFCASRLAETRAAQLAARAAAAGPASKEAPGRRHKRKTP